MVLMSSMQAHHFVSETKAQRSGFCFASPEVRRRERWLCRRRKSLNLLGAPKKLRFFGGGDPWESRTPVCGVRGRRLDHLTNGPSSSQSPIFPGLRFPSLFFQSPTGTHPRPNGDSGAPSRTRTGDPLIKSQLLYQLS